MVQTKPKWDLIGNTLLLNLILSHHRGRVAGQSFTRTPNLLRLLSIEKFHASNTIIPFFMCSISLAQSCLHLALSVLTCYFTQPRHSWIIKQVIEYTQLDFAWFLGSLFVCFTCAYRLCTLAFWPAPFTTNLCPLREPLKSKPFHPHLSLRNQRWAFYDRKASSTLQHVFSHHAINRLYREAESAFVEAWVETRQHSAYTYNVIHLSFFLRFTAGGKKDLLARSALRD